MSFGKHCPPPGLFAQLLPQDSLQLSTRLEWQAPSDGLGKGSATPGMVVWSLFTPFFRSKRKGDAVFVCRRFSPQNMSERQNLKLLSVM